MRKNKTVAERKVKNDERERYIKIAIRTLVAIAVLILSFLFLFLLQDAQEGVFLVVIGIIIIFGIYFLFTEFWQKGKSGTLETTLDRRRALGNEDAYLDIETSDGREKTTGLNRNEFGIGKNMSDRTSGNWWRSRSKQFRAWAFGSAVWITFVFLFILVFDPFDYGGLSYMNGEEFIQIFFIMATPLLAAGIKYTYDRFVK